MYINFPDMLDAWARITVEGSTAAMRRRFAVAGFAILSLLGLTPLGRMVCRLRMCTWYPLPWFSWLTILATNSWSAIRRFLACLVDLHGSSPCTAWDTFSSAAAAFSLLDFIFIRLHAVPCPGSTATERGPPTDCTSIQPTLRWPCLLGTI